MLETIFYQPHLLERLQHIREPLHLLKNEATQQIGCFLHHEYEQNYSELSHQTIIHIGVLPAIYPEWLGDTRFNATHGVRFPYIVGEMANGIATAKMVIATAKAGMLGFFGAAGLMPPIIEKNLHEIKNQLGDAYNWGANLIHSPQEPFLEAAAVNLFLENRIRRVSASAYMTLSPYIVHYACKGLHVDADGTIHRQNHVLAKISRPEVAQHFLSPAPKEMLTQLVQCGKISQEEAQLAAYVPIAEDITVEADSGGHTDNRPLTVLLPIVQALAQKLTQQFQYRTTIRIGAAGGLGTPSSLAAAFSLGASYVLTGTINQSAVESGLCDEGKKMLAEAGMADVAMTAAADMFELGVKLQVLKRGTFFPSRANKLYEIYTRYDGLDSIPLSEKLKLEKEIFHASLDKIWEKTKAFFLERDPEQISRAEKDTKHRMALVFRWYLGLSSQWAIQGISERKMDYQIWCGPAMGAFNNWVSGTFLENLTNRTVEQIGRNLLEGAAVITRTQQLRSFGIMLPAEAFHYQPRPLQ